jgi:hypothetical protein
MTSKKGSLWKTSWNRGRGTPPAPIVGNMAFFQDFNAGANLSHYATVVNTTLGLALPYWFAAVGINRGSQFALESGFNITVSSDTDRIDAQASVPGALAAASLGVSGDSYVSAAIAIVTDAGGGVPRLRVRFEDQQVVTSVGPVPYGPPPSLLQLFPLGLPGGLHGLCGGPGTPTDFEIKTWFKQLKNLLTIPPIPGKTTHLYSAGAVFPAVPAVLTNLGTDATQNMNLVITLGAPTPANNLIPVRFAY